MNARERLLTVVTIGGLAAGGWGIKTSMENYGARIDHAKWTQEKAELASSFSQTPQSDQTKIDNIRKEIITLDQKLSTDKRNEETEAEGSTATVMGLGAALFSSLFLTTEKIIHRQQNKK